MIGDCIPLLFLLVWVFCKQKLLFFHLVCRSHFGDILFFPPKSWSTFWLRGTASTPAPSARTGSRVGPPHQYRVQEEQYNRYIAGGDRFDQNLNHLRVTIGGKKWYWWIVTWLLDTALQNSGQLHKKAGGQMSMLVVRDVVCTMLRQGATMCSSWTSSGVPRTGPIDDLGYDQLSHFIEKSPYIFFNKKLKISSLLCCHCFVQYY